MGQYLNPSSIRFKEALNSRIYVDKSELIAFTNDVLHTQQKYICVSRPRRFGKSMAAHMLAAYYTCAEDTRELFAGLRISQKDSYEKHLNRYDVVMINVQEFLSKSNSVEEMIALLENRVIRELDKVYQVKDMNREHLDWAMQDVYDETQRSFIILIDEWDCLFREYEHNIEAQKRYLDFLRSWLKDRPFVCMAYMTGILPVKKYGSHSALNMFSEYSMTDPGDLAPYFGFTENEVKELCEKYQMNYEEAGAWYNGYGFSQSSADGKRRLSMYNPKSVVEAMLRHSYKNYWNQTETYEALKVYIQMNYEGLKEDVVTMLAGGNVPVDIERFSNDMTTFSGKDDVLTLLIHLGYLTYNETAQHVSIPNKEVSQEYVNAVKGIGWSEVIHSIERSKQLLEAVWQQNNEAVALGIDSAHREVSILQYNDENALSYTINLAFYAAKEYYNMIREMPAGNGYADICLIPRRLHQDKPAAVIELKWNRSACGAIEQIKNRKYVEALESYKGNLLLVGINYDKRTKKHQCEIEKWNM